MLENSIDRLLVELLQDNETDAISDAQKETIRERLGQSQAFRDEILDRLQLTEKVTNLLGEIPAIDASPASPTKSSAPTTAPAFW